MPTSSILRSLLATSVIAASSFVISVAAATPAAAAASCSGTVTWSHNIKYHGEVAGQLVIYYNSSNGGTNSACFYHRGDFYGRKRPTDVTIRKCRETSGEGKFTCTRSGSAKTDDGNYSYYAGPVAVTGTARNCVQAEGSMVIPGESIPLGLSSPRVGC